MVLDLLAPPPSCFGVTQTLAILVILTLLPSVLTSKYPNTHTYKSLISFFLQGRFKRGQTPNQLEKKFFSQDGVVS